MDNLLNNRVSHSVKTWGHLMEFHVIRSRSPARPPGLELESGLWKIVLLVFQDLHSLSHIFSCLHFFFCICSTFPSFSPCVVSLCAHFGHGPMWLSEACRRPRQAYRINRWDALYPKHAQAEDGVLWVGWRDGRSLQITLVSQKDNIYLIAAWIPGLFRKSSKPSLPACFPSEAASQENSSF